MKGRALRRAALALVPVAALALPVAALGRGADNSIAAAMNDLQLRVVRDVAYGEDPRQRFDVYLPGVARGPILLVVHGGAWRGGDKRSRALILPKVRHWTARGFVVVSTNYRLLPRAHPLEQARDVARALAWVQRRAVAWGAEPTQVVLMGHSSGGHLVSLLAADPALAREQGADRWLGTISVDSPVFDVPALLGQPHAPLFDRAFGTHAAYWKAVSPLHVLSRDARPLLAVCSRRSSQACAQAQAYAQAAGQRGIHVEVQAVDLRHADTNGQLGLPGAYTESVERWISSIL